MTTCLKNDGLARLIRRKVFDRDKTPLLKIKDLIRNFNRPIRKQHRLSNQLCLLLHTLLLCLKLRGTH